MGGMFSHDSHVQLAVDTSTHSRLQLQHLLVCALNAPEGASAMHCLRTCRPLRHMHTVSMCATLAWPTHPAGALPPSAAASRAASASGPAAALSPAAPCACGRAGGSPASHAPCLSCVVPGATASTGCDYCSLDHRSRPRQGPVFTGVQGRQRRLRITASAVQHPLPASSGSSSGRAALPTSTVPWAYSRWPSTPPSRPW
jgi:hypothetical protein